jgi:hypothetical protein
MSRIYASFAPKNLKFNTAQKTLMLSALGGLYMLVKSWVWIANPAGQASQRTPSWDVTATIKVMGRKNPITVKMPIGFQVAYNPQTGSQRKGDMTRWLTALRIGDLENFPRIVEIYAEHLTFFGYKMLTSLDTSREGCLMARCLDALENEGKAKLLTLQYGENEVIERDAIENSMSGKIAFSKRAIEGEFWVAKTQSLKSSRTLGDITI